MATAKKKQKQDSNDPLKFYPTIKMSALEKYKPNLNDVIAGKGFLKRGSSTTLNASTNFGKSVMVEQWAVELATGRPLLGVIPVRKPAKVLLIEAENDMDILKIDFCAIADHYKIKMSSLDDMISVRHVPGLSAKMFGEYLEKFLVADKPDVVMIDTYQAYISYDMNQTAPFFEWRNVVDTLIKHFKVAFLMTTHPPKPQERKGWSDEEYSYMMAGTAAIANWVRVACNLIKIKDDATLNKYKLHFSKSPSRTGILSETGDVVRELFVERSGNADAPFWMTSDKQQGGATVVSIEKEVRKIWNAHSGFGYKKLHKLMPGGITLGQVKYHVARFREEGKKKGKRK